MRDAEPSGSAWRVARRRAAHQILDRPPVFVDPLALTILGEDEARSIRADPEDGVTSQALPFLAALRAFLAIRSRVAEETLQTLVTDGLTQFVVLGAGLDTFACRNPYPWLRVWEVDHPQTQAWKRSCLERAGIVTPASLTFVPVDFTCQTLCRALTDAGLDPTVPTFFSWLGVTVYLPDEAIRSTLATVAAFAGPGGGVVFDYGVPPASLSWRQRAVFDRMAKRLEAAGEPWRTFFTPADITAMLESAGFTTIEDLSGDDLNSRYFHDRQDGLKVGRLGRVVRALRPMPRRGAPCVGGVTSQAYEDAV